MPASHDSYIRRQGRRQRYDIDYTSLRYQISLDGKVLKKTQLSLQQIGGAGSESGAAIEKSWRHAVADIEFLRGMQEE
jgi:hypothetical protein